MTHMKNSMVELVSYNTLSSVLSPFYDIRKLHYRVIRINEIYINNEIPSYRGEILFDAKENETTIHRPYFSDYATEQGVWFTEGENQQAIKLIALNQLFIFLSDKMKIEESSNYLLNNFMDILGLITCYRESVTVKIEEEDGTR